MMEGESKTVTWSATNAEDKAKTGTATFELYNQPEIKEIVNKYFSYEKMLHTFPNIKVTGKDGNIIWVCDILKDIQPYYFRVFEPKLR